jgi:hypothetical protein
VRERRVVRLSTSVKDGSGGINNQYRKSDKNVGAIQTLKTERTTTAFESHVLI